MSKCNKKISLHIDNTIQIYYAYHVLGCGGAHLGAAIIINTAPTSIPTHKIQNVTNKIQRSLIQKGSLAYFISSSLSIPTNEGLMSPRIKSDHRFLGMVGIKIILFEDFE